MTRKDLSDLSVGEGGIVEVDGKRIGVYRYDYKGKVISGPAFLPLETLDISEA